MPGDNDMPFISNITTQEDMDRVLDALRHHKGNEAQALAPSLKYAAFTGNTDLLDVLLTLCASSSTVGCTGGCILHLAVAAGKHDAVRVLLKHHAPVDHLDGRSFTPLQVAALIGNPHTATALLDGGASTISRFDSYSSTALEMAAYNGSVATIKVLLAHKADVNAANAGGVTALHQAAMVDNVDAIRELVQAKANTNKRDINGWGPLHFSSHRNNAECVKALCVSRTNVDMLDTSGFAPLHVAIMEMSFDAVEELLNAGADVELRELDTNASALDMAAAYGSVRMVMMLLDHGANTDAVDRKHRTALHKVNGPERLAVINAIVQAGGAVDARDEDGRTPLHYAAWWSAVEGVHGLLLHGAKVNAPDYDGKTPLHMAARVSTDDSSAAVVKLLLRWDANVAAANDDGQTAADVLGYDVEPGVNPNGPPTNDVVLALLVTALTERRERAWRRRCLPVMWRARLNKVRKELQERKSAEENGASGGACGVVTRKRPRLEMVDGGGQGIEAVLDAVAEMQEDDVFRNLIGFL